MEFCILKIILSCALAVIVPSRYRIISRNCCHGVMSLCFMEGEDLYVSTPLQKSGKRNDEKTDQSRLPLADELSAPHCIGLTEFRKFALERHGLVIDARPALFFNLGHIPSAVNIPREDFKREYLSNSRQLEGCRGNTIAVYCSNADCDDSKIVATALIDLGYKHPVIFKDGWDGWKKAGLPEEKDR